MNIDPAALRADNSMEGVRWSRNAILTVGLCALAGGVDSFDTQMIGFTGRQIATDLHFPVGQLGWLFGSGQLGGILGAFLFGPLADRFGRVRMLWVTCLLAAVFTALTLSVHSYRLLLIFRVLTGIGLGGVMPCFLGLGVEAMPPKVRVGLTPMLYACFPLGGVAGAWISAPLIAAFGWRGVFAFAAAALIGAAMLVAILPLTQDRTAVSDSSGSVAVLFRGNAARVTWPLWGLFLLATPGVYLLVLWMPPLLQLLGVTAAQTSVLVGFANVGALFVSLAGGWLLVYFGRLRLIAPILLSGALGLSVIAAVYRDFPVLVAVSVLTGAALGGSMSLLVSIAATAYPTAIRATGIGYAMGIGRLGQMSAPIPIGMLLSAGISPQLTLAACGLPTMCSLIPLFFLDRNLRRADHPISAPSLSRTGSTSP